MRQITIPIIVEVPDDATHFHGDLTDHPSFFKCTQVGVGGDHWWSWSEIREEWLLVSHHKPHWIKELPSS